VLHGGELPCYKIGYAYWLIYRGLVSHLLGVSSS
jgi:hypothetical protein